MNVTEEKMVKAFREGRNVCNGPTKVWEYRGFREMGCNRDEVKDGCYLLWGTIIAEKGEKHLLLGTKAGNWRTVTTKGRINAISTAFKVPGIIQNKGVWTWSDGAPYEGVRVFEL